MLRTYELKTDINKGKKEKILSVLREYRKTASVIGNKQWELFYKESSFNKNHLKNKVRRIINRIIALYNHGEIVIEKLNFTSPNLFLTSVR